MSRTSQPKSPTKSQEKSPPAIGDREARLLRASVKYAGPSDADDAVPADPELARYALARKLLTFSRMPRRCREPVCRRSKRCAGPDMRCQRDFPQPPMTPEEDARVRAEVRRLLDREIARREAAGQM